MPANSTEIEVSLSEEKLADRLVVRLKKLGAQFIPAPKPTELRAVFPLSADRLKREVYMITFGIDASGRVTHVEKEVVTLQLEPGMTET